jgi:hypothetical protein
VEVATGAGTPIPLLDGTQSLVGTAAKKPTGGVRNLRDADGRLKCPILLSSFGPSHLLGNEEEQLEIAFVHLAEQP